MRIKYPFTELKKKRREKQIYLKGERNSWQHMVLPIWHREGPKMLPIQIGIKLFHPSYNI